MAEEESNLVKHARRELLLLGNGPWIDDHILAMVKIFSETGHSGSSAAYSVDLLTRLLNYENLMPLTDNPDEWHFVTAEFWGSPGGIWQNNRNSDAFSNDGGKTYYLLSEGGNDKNRSPLHKSADHKAKEKLVASLRTKGYKNKSNHEVVRAVRVTVSNYDAIAERACKTVSSYSIRHVDADGQESKQRVKVGKLVAQLGDFVVFPTEGKAFRVKDDVFEASYTLVK